MSCKPANSRRGNDIKIPASNLHSLSSNPENPKPGFLIFSHVQNVIVGENALAIQAAQEGHQAESLDGSRQGEAREMGIELAQKLRVTTMSGTRPVCLIAGENQPLH